MTKKDQSQKKLFGIGALVGLTTLSISLASVPSTVPSRVTDDTAIYQSLSEIRISKEAKPNFDGDIARLSALEGRYREHLPTLARRPELRGPMQRIAQKKYQYSGRTAVRKPVISRQ